MAKIMALTIDGNLSYCTVDPSERGKGRCNHVGHQEENESVDDFIQRVNSEFGYGENYKSEVKQGEVTLEQYKMTPEEKSELVMILGRKQLEEDIDGGYIELKEPLWNDMDKNAFSQKSGMPVRDINAVLNKSKYMVTDTEIDLRGVKEGQVVTEAKMKAIEEKHGDLVKFDNGVVCLNEYAAKHDFEATKDVYVLPYYLRQDPPGGNAKNPINTLYNYLIVKRKDPDVQQQAYDSLLNNSKSVKPITQRGGYAIDSLAEKFKGKSGVMRAYMSGRSIKHSGRAVITPEIDMEYGVAKVPASMAANIFEPNIKDYLHQKGYTEEQTKEYLDKFKGVDQVDIDPKDRESLNHIVKSTGGKIILNRQPSLHGLSLLSFRPEISPDATIKINPLNMPGYNADIDGDTMTCFGVNDVEVARKTEEFSAENSTHLPRAKDKLMTKPAKEALWGLFNILSKRS